MFSIANDFLSKELNQVREIVEAQEGNVKLIDYLFSQITVTYRINQQKLTFAGLPSTHVDELKAVLGNRKLGRIPVMMSIPTGNETIQVNYGLHYRIRLGNYQVVDFEQLQLAKIKCINLAGVKYSLRYDLFKSKALSTTFNEISNMLMTCGYTTYTHLFQPLIDEGNFKIELYGKRNSVVECPISGFDLKVDPDTSITDTMKDIRYQLAPVLNHEIAKNIDGLMIVNVTLQCKDYNLASFHIARDKEGYWGVTTHELPHSFSVHTAMVEGTPTLVFPERFVNHKVKHAPLLTEMMHMLEDYCVEESGRHYCLSAEAIEVIHNAIEDHVRAGGIYLASPKTMPSLGNGKVYNYVSEDTAVNIPGLDIIADVGYSIHTVDWDFNLNSPFEFTNIGQFRFDEHGITATSIIGSHSIVINVKTAECNFDVKMLLSAFTALATEAMVKWSNKMK